MELTEKQKECVEACVPLVRHCLRTSASEACPPSRDREYDDLFQEGCVALIRAARRFRPERHADFAVYALPRIRAAVRRTMQRGFATVRVPVTPDAGAGREKHPECKSLGRRQLIDHRTDPDVRVGRMADPARKPAMEPGNEDGRARTSSGPDGTARVRGGDCDPAERLRRRIHLAANKAARHWLKSCEERWLLDGETKGARVRQRRRIRVEVVRRIVAERLLIPEPEWRTPLESIGRAFGVGRATVLRWERELTDEMRRRLEEDREVRRLLRGRQGATGGDVRSEVEPGGA